MMPSLYSDSRYHDPHTFAALLLLSSHHENHTVKFDDGHGESDYDIPRSINRHIIQLSEDDSMISVKDLKSCELRMLSPSEVNEEGGGYLSRSSPGMEEEIYATSFPLRAMDAVPPPSESLKSDLVASTSSALMQWIQAYKVDADRKDIYSDGEDCINLNKGGGNSSLLQVSVSSHVKVQGLMKTMMEVLDAIMEPIESLVAATLGGSIIGAMSVKVIQVQRNTYLLNLIIRTLNPLVKRPVECRQRDRCLSNIEIERRFVVKFEGQPDSSAFSNYHRIHY
jgi:hypothetical protein